jgi:hypothetical protein
VKLDGNDVVNEVSDTEKILDAESSILNSLPVVVPFEPMLSENKSPVAVVEDPGDQSRFKSEPVPVEPVKAVEVVRISARVPELKVLADPVDSWNNFPVVIEDELT